MVLRFAPETALARSDFSSLCQKIRFEREEKLQRNGIRGGLYTFTTQATCTHKPFDALAIDAWATLAAALGDVDWRLAKRCRRSFEDLMTERTAGISQIATAFIVTAFVEGAKNGWWCQVGCGIFGARGW